MVPAWELDINISDIDLTFLITLASTFVLAIVAAALLDPVAWLQAVHSLMQSLRVALVDTRVPTGQALSTEEVISGFWRNTREVVRAGYRKRGLWMAWTTKLELRANVVTLVEHFEHFPPHGYRGRCLSVADDVHSMLCSR